MAIKPETGMNAFPAVVIPRALRHAAVPAPVLTILDRATFVTRPVHSAFPPVRSKEQGNLRPVSARSTFS